MMRFREGTASQTVLFTAVVGVFVLAAATVAHVEARALGRPDTGVRWMEVAGLGYVAWPQRADVANAGVTYRSVCESVNGAPVRALSRREFQALFHRAVGDTNRLGLRRPDGRRLEVAVPIQRRTWGDALYVWGVPAGLGALWCGIGVLGFLARPYERPSWALLCVGAFWGAACMRPHPWLPGEVFYSAAGLLVNSLYAFAPLHVALAFPVPHPWLRRPARVLSSLYSGAALLGGVLAFSWWQAARIPVRDRVGWEVVPVAAAGTATLTYVFRLATRAWGERDRLIRQRARLLLLGVGLPGVALVLWAVARFILRHTMAVPTTITLGLSVAVALSLAYATVRYDLLDVRAIVRRAVACAMAGGIIVGLLWLGGRVSPLLGVVLLVPVFLARPRFNALMDMMLYPKRTQYPDLRRCLGAELDAARTRDEVLEILASVPQLVCDTDSGAAFFLPGVADRNERISGSGEVDVSEVHNLAEEPLIRLLVDGRRPIAREAIEVDPRFARTRDEARALMTKLRAAVLLPIERDGTVVGGLAVGPHLRGEVYDPLELKLLRELGRRAARALDAAALREQEAAGQAAVPTT